MAAGTRSLRARRLAAFRDAQRWLEALDGLHAEPQSSLRRMGLSLCGWVGDADRREIRNWVAHSSQVDARVLAALVRMPRDQLMQWLMTTSTEYGEGMDPVGGSPGRATARDLLGALSVSYARSDDLAACAALLRTAASLELRGGPLTWAESYVLDQQRPEGYFGFLMREIAIAGSPTHDVAPHLRLTVDVLWALAAIEEADRLSDSYVRTLGRHRCRTTHRRPAK